MRVRSDSETEMVADVIVGFSALRESFTSRVEKKRAETLSVDYVDGPLKHLRNEWAFRPDGAGGTFVDFSVDFAFRSVIFEKIAGQMFDRALRKMIGAFEQRAAALYGPVESGISRSSAKSAA